MELLKFSMATTLFISSLCLALKKAEVIQCKKTKANHVLIKTLNKRFKIKSFPRFQMLLACRNPNHQAFALKGGLEYE